MRIVIAALTLWLASLPLYADTVGGVVVRVADGDTITVLDDSKKQHKVRLVKIDAPEKAQAYGQASKKHLSSFVAGKAVTVEYEKKDQYGRILGEVFVGELNVNLQMVKDGMAWHYAYYDNTPSYTEAEKEARAKKLGLWQDPNPVPPYEFRKRARK